MRPLPDDWTPAPWSAEPTWRQQFFEFLHDAVFFGLLFGLASAILLWFYLWGTA
jgi:hypothetical protein